jgi:hypothetical protein
MKGMPHLTFAAATIAVSVGLSQQSLAAPAIVGDVDKVQAQVYATQGDATRTLEARGPVYFRDHMRTGPGARLEAKLDDDTQLTLGENGRLTIDEFVYRPGQIGGKLIVDVSKGAFLFVGGKVEDATGGNVSIKTVIGTLAVRGTTVWGGPIDGGFGVLVLKGEVVVHTRRGNVVLKQGNGTMILHKGKPQPAGPWPEERTKRAVASISFL